MSLIGFVMLYMAVSIGIGLYAATRVKTTQDYALAGRSLPLRSLRGSALKRCWVFPVVLLRAELPE